MNRFIRDSGSGAAILADRHAVEEYLQKKTADETIDSLREELDRLRQDILQLKKEIHTNEKR